MKRNLIVVTIAAVVLAGCVTMPPAPPKVETQPVDVAVPVQCAVKVDKPRNPIARSVADVQAMLAAAPNVTEKARIVSEQLLLWIGYGPKLEAALDGCRAVPQPSVAKGSK